jgi:hypothetical protein
LKCGTLKFRQQKSSGIMASDIVQRGREDSRNRPRAYLGDSSNRNDVRFLLIAVPGCSTGYKSRTRPLVTSESPASRWGFSIWGNRCRSSAWFAPGAAPIQFQECSGCLAGSNPPLELAALLSQ